MKKFGFMVIVLALICVVGLVALSTDAHAEELASGTCGENLTWVLTDDGVLTISGIGDMKDYYESYSVPWADYHSLISSVVIERGVTSIGNCAFEDIKSLRSAKISEGISSIGENVFYGCTNLSSVTIPDSITNIGADAFYGCSNLDEVSIESLECWLGINFHKSTSNPLSNGAILYISEQPVTDIIIPAGIDQVFKYAFYGYHELDSVAISDSVTRIGESAFYGCDNLTSITIPDGVTSIREHAFHGCSKLLTVTIPNSVTYIGDAVFMACDSLWHILYKGTEEEWKSIDNELWTPAPESIHYNCTGDEIVDGICTICNPTNSNTVASGICGENVTWELDDSGTLIISGTGKMYDFDYATAPWYDWNDDIKHIEIGEGVTSVGDFAFYFCYQVTSVELPNGLTRIGESAFEFCDNLCDILIPDSVSKIESAAFLWCCSLTSINIPSGITVIEDMVFQWCTGLTEVNIPDSVSVIGYQSFMGCSGLVSVTIPKSVTEIKQNAFVGCENLMCITLSEGVVRIGDRAFQFCDKIWHVLYTGTEQEWNKITIGADNECFTTATRHYNATGDERVNPESRMCTICDSICEHSWNEATCTEPKTCSICGGTEGKPKGHNYTGTVMSPTCTEKGYTTHTCANCGDTYVDTYMDALGHDWDEGVVTQEPTETSTGKKLFTCNACGETMVESIPELNHTHSYTETVIQPTCTERGYTAYICACGDEYTDNYVDAVGHQYNSDGVCTICGQKDPNTGETIPTEPAPTEPTNTQPSTEPSETDPAGNGAQNGGSNSFVLIAVLFAAGGIGIGIGIGLITRKKK